MNADTGGDDRSMKKQMAAGRRQHGSQLTANRLRLVKANVAE